MEQQLVLFDYSSLDSDTRAFVQEKTEAIHARLKRTAEDIIAIGSDLTLVKNRLGYGQFDSWVQSEFEMSRRTAYRFMQVTSKLGSRANLAQVAPSVLYLLAESSDTVIEMVETGQIEATIPAIREAKQAERVVVIPEPAFPPGFGLVNGKPFTMPLPDGKPINQEEFDRVFPPLHSPSDLPARPHTPPPMPYAPVVSTQPEYRPYVPPTPVYTPPLPAPRGVPPALQMSESNEWYTPSRYVDAARELMGGIDLDPASNAYANEIVQALNYYTQQDNGLSKAWRGRIWLNPPYGIEDGMSNQERWTHYLINQYMQGNVTEAVLLVNANTEAKWFQPLYDYLICLTDHRIRFYNTSGDSSQPTQGNAFVYLGSQEERFVEIFSKFGNVVKKAVAA